MPAKIFARLPAYNPFVGTFHHAPSAGNRGAAYFWSDIVGVDELAERKKFRHNPLTGTFHALPGYYDPLHGLRQFRHPSYDDERSPVELRRTVSAPTSPQKGPWPLHRMFSAPIIENPIDLPKEVNSTTSRRYSYPLLKVDKEEHGRHSVEKISPSNASLSSSGSSSSLLLSTTSTSTSTSTSNSETSTTTNSISTLHSISTTNSMDSRQDQTNLLGFSKNHPLDMETTTTPILAGEVANAWKDLKMDGENHDRSSSHIHDDINSSFGHGIHFRGGDHDAMSLPSSRSTNSYTGSDGNNIITEEELLGSPITDGMSNHLGYISTGKGVFRTSLCQNDNSRCTSPSSNPALEEDLLSLRLSNESSSVVVSHLKKLENSSHRHSSEYSQSAPRRPSNPFVARRLSDGDQIRIMAINRVAPRVLSDEPLKKYSNLEALEEHYMIAQPKPYFIHEKAVTEQYELVGEDQLGDGSYAVVKRAIRRNNGLKVAIKQIHKRYLLSAQAKKAVEREVELHQRLRDKHIIQLFEVYETEDFLYLVMDIATKGNLKSLLLRKRRLCEPLAGRIAQQMLRAVFYLHEHGVLHCDIKPENVLLTDPPKSSSNCSGSKGDGNSHRVVNPADPFADVRACDLQVKVCDFGLAIKVPDARFYKYTGDVHKVPYTGLTGTPGYIAPELMERQAYGKPVDMWSIGVVIYEMLTGYQPFYPPHACIDTSADFRDPVWKSVSPDARDLVEKLLDTDPNSRYTIQDAVSHSWFENTAFAF